MPDYNSDLFNRDVMTGEVNKDGITVGKLTETAVELAAPMIGGKVATPVKAAPQTLESLDALPKSITNTKVRIWYNEKLKVLNTNVEFTEANARLLNAQRNALKVEARSMMVNRKAAATLEKSDPIRSFEYHVEKYSKQGYTGEALWEKIIKGSAKPNATVNQKFGIK